MFRSATASRSARNRWKSMGAALLKKATAVWAARKRWRRNGVSSPTGTPSAKRGQYRIVYRLNESEQVVEVLRIDHRLGIYRNR